LDKRKRRESSPGLPGLGGFGGHEVAWASSLGLADQAASYVRSSKSRLIKAGNEEGKRNRKPDKERRVVRIISAVVITSAVISAAPIATVLSSVSVVSVTAVIIPAMIVPVAAGMNGSMTGMGGTGLRRSNSEEGNKNKTQRCYGFHVNYYNSVARWQTLELFADGSSSYQNPPLNPTKKIWQKRLRRGESRGMSAETIVIIRMEMA
jgi:hypothetical protein